MKLIDRFLQRYRFSMIRNFIPQGGKILDIGCNCCELFSFFEKKGIHGVGIDNDSKISRMELPTRITFINDEFPSELLINESFDCLTVIAVFEHIPTQKQDEFASACFHLTRPGGFVILTIPSPFVDYIIHFLEYSGLIDQDMNGHQHHQYDPSETNGIFGRAGYKLYHHRKFQFGLNNVFVFQRPELI